MASAGPIVRYEGVHLELGGRPVLRGLDLAVERGETLVLLGRSGSGKTSALRMLNAMLRPTSGAVFVFGENVAEQDRIALRRKVGYVIQGVGLFPHFTVERNVGLIPELERWPGERRKERVRELLAMVGLEGYGERYPRQLSGGQQQRVGIARALAASPPLLLLDEPFGALDPLTRVELQNEFLRLREVTGTTAVFVTHDIHEAVRVGSRIGVLHEGRLETLGSVQQFQRETSGEAGRFLACLDPAR